MSIKEFHINFPGQVDIKPRLGHLYTTDTLSQVTTAGYLNPYMKAQNFDVKPTDVILVAASNGRQFYKVVIDSSNVVTLTVLP